MWGQKFKSNEVMFGMQELSLHCKNSCICCSLSSHRPSAVLMVPTTLDRVFHIYVTLEFINDLKNALEKVQMWSGSLLEDSKLDYILFKSVVLLADIFLCLTLRENVALKISFSTTSECAIFLRDDYVVQIVDLHGICLWYHTNSSTFSDDVTL